MDISELTSHFPQLEFKLQEPLAPYTYMKVGGPAECFVEIASRDDLYAVCALCFEKNIPFLVLGGASNVVIADEGLKGLVIRNITRDIRFSSVDHALSQVTADSGVITALLANKTMEMGLSGLEYFIGVPGTIGGAVVNNSHFTAQDLIGNLVHEVEVCTPQGKRETWHVEQLKFDYDYSIFHEQKDIVLSVTFSLTFQPKEVIQERVKAAALKRTSTQPIGVPSSGCMYRNPQVSAEQFAVLSSKLSVPTGAYHDRTDGTVQVAAGYLIDQAGLKGTKVGDVQVSEKHATYMVNLGKATTHDIENLCQLVEKTVKDKFGVTLVREVFFLK